MSGGSFHSVLALAVAGLLAAGCGRGGGSDRPDVEIELTTRDHFFEPASVTAPSGAVLVLTNEGGFAHNFSVENEDIGEDVAVGQSKRVPLELPPGVYDFVCRFHEVRGMVGVLTVE
jgi:plastocyanin